jgi:CRP-like cAMP-binding protein
MNSSSNNIKYFETFDLIFKPGQPVKDLFIVQSGKVITFQLSDGRIVPISMAMSGDFLGHDAVFNKDQYMSYAVALDRTGVAPIRNNDISDILKNSPEWVRNLIETMSNRLNSTQEILSEFKIISSELTNDEELTPQLEAQLLKILQKSNA